MIFKKIFVQPKSLLLIFVVTAIIIFASTLFELNQSKKEMLVLMESQSHTLLESLLKSSDNALTSYNQFEEEITKRLLNNAELIKTMYEKGLISNSFLKDIAAKNNIYRVNIFSKNGRKVFTSHTQIHQFDEDIKAPENLRPIFEDETDTLIIGIKPARLESGKRFAVAISASNRSAIVLNVDAEELLNFGNQVGFGTLLKDITNNSNIEYVALQDYDGIIAASGSVEFLEDIDSSVVLEQTLQENKYNWRIVEHGDKEVFEALHPFIHNDYSVGVFRLGLSLEPLENINNRITQRMILTGVVIFLFGYVTLILIFTRQNFTLLNKRYKEYEVYSQNIFENINDGVIVLDSALKIKTINKSALKLLGVQDQESNDIKQVFGDRNCSLILNSEIPILQIDCIIKGQTKYFIVSKSIFTPNENETNTVLIISDVTDQKKLEKQIQRNERMTAMGELASSVAHEIRNPLNTIGTITQQLRKDFAPVENIEEYKTLSELVYKEVKRINETIENFLIFAKPLPLKPELINTSQFFAQIKKQYDTLLNQKGIKLILNENWSGEVKWDPQQIRQVLINLLENSIDSIGNHGTIELSIYENANNKIEIKVADSGKGITDEIVNKIFDLYFTTKLKGNGIGLSVVQKIIYEHNGIISVENKPKAGAVFSIIIPKNI